jgi:hypothetical protein
MTDSVSGNVKGTAYDWETYTSGKTTRPSFKVSVKIHSGGLFMVTRENMFDRLFKWLGFSREIKTGDAEFDKKFYIHTDTVDFTRELFSDPAKRQAVREILGKGFDRLICDGKHIIAMRCPVRESQKLDAAGIKETVSLLEILSLRLPASAEKKTASPGKKSKGFIPFAAYLALLLLSGMTTMILGFVDYWPLAPFRLFLDSLKVSIPLLLVFLWLVRRQVRGRSWPRQELAAVFVAAIFIHLVFVFGAELYINGAWDRAESTVYIVKVTDKYVEESEDSVRHYAVVDSWREPGTRETFKITDLDYSRLQPGKSRIRVFIKPGTFNFPWLKGYKLAHEPGKKE